MATEDECLLALVRRGINDPGSVLPREADEWVGAWGARAVVQLLTEANLLKTERPEPPPKVEHFRIGPGRCNCGYDAYVLAA